MCLGIINVEALSKLSIRLCLELALAYFISRLLKSLHAKICISREQHGILEINTNNHSFTCSFVRAYLCEFLLTLILPTEAIYDRLIP